MDWPHLKKKKEKEMKGKESEERRRRKEALQSKSCQVQTGHFKISIFTKEEHLEQHKMSFFVIGAQVVKPVTWK